MGPERSRRQRGVGVLSVLLVLVVACAALLVAVNLLASSRVRSARAGWDETLGSFDEVMSRYPTTTANAAALELERIAADLGVDLVPRSRPERPDIGAEAGEAFQALKREVFGVYTQQIERAQRGDVAAPPEQLAGYVETYHDELVALRSRLLSGEMAVWESDTSRLMAAPLPNLLGHINLAKLLLHGGIERLHAGDRATALEYAEALSNLSSTLRHSPNLINQLILIAEVRMLAGLLRQVEDLPGVWADRLVEHDYRQSFTNAMKYEGWVWLAIDSPMVTGAAPPWWYRLAMPALRPYSRLCAADLSAAWRQRIVNLEQVDALCDDDLAAQQADFDIPVPRWNTLGDMIPNLLNAVDRLARLQLDIELTRLMARHDAERRANGGTWPEPSAERLPSQACPRDAWDVRLDAGALHIGFSREIAWPAAQGVILPTRTVMR